MKQALTLVTGLLLVAGLAAAGSHGSLMTADHPLYSAKMAGEAGVEELAPNETEQVKAKLHHAEKRANESQELADENKTDLANQTANAYAAEMQEVNDLGSTISDLAQQQKIDELVAAATQHHAAVLSAVYERVPDQAKAGIQKALNTSVNGHKRAVQSMENRGQPTDNLNMTAHIPANVQDKTGIDISNPLGGGGNGSTAGSPGGNDTGSANTNGNGYGY